MCLPGPSAITPSNMYRHSHAISRQSPARREDNQQFPSRLPTRSPSDSPSVSGRRHQFALSGTAPSWGLPRVMFGFPNLPVRLPDMNPTGLTVRLDQTGPDHTNAAVDDRGVQPNECELSSRRGRLSLFRRYLSVQSIRRTAIQLAPRKTAADLRTFRAQCTTMRLFVLGRGRRRCNEPLESESC